MFNFSNSISSLAFAIDASSTMPFSRFRSVFSCSFCVSSLRNSVLAAYSSFSRDSFEAFSLPKTAAAIICSSLLGSSAIRSFSVMFWAFTAFNVVSETNSSHFLTLSMEFSCPSRAADHLISHNRALYSCISPASRLYLAACRDCRFNDRS